MMLPSLEIVIAGAMLVALTIYVLTGGADYGGGAWDLLAFGPRAKQQRQLIAKALAPIWEANHVWLILVIVLLFTCFPPAFATITTALHIPLVLMLCGIVLRGTAFTFRTYDKDNDENQQRWGGIFAMSSTVTPVFIGIVVGAISSGNVIIRHHHFLREFVRPWLAPFPVAVGFFALAIFAFLAAVYLTAEADDPLLVQDFKMRAIVSGIAVGIMAFIVFVLSAHGAPVLSQALSTRHWTWPLHIATAISAIGVFISLWKNQFRKAQLFAVAQVTLILWGWAFAQQPYLVQPNLTIYNCSAPQITLELVLIALALGVIIIFPSFYYLFKVFKGSD